MTRHLPFRLTAALVVLAVPLLAAAQSGGRQTSGGARVTQPTKAGSPAAVPAVRSPAAKPSGAVAGQAPKRGAAAPTPAPKPAATAEAGSAGATYNFHASRRDPFVSLWTPGTGPRQRSKVEGLAGLYTSELTVKGILQSNGRFVAIVLGQDGKRQYIVHPNDRLADGVVKAITADSLLILQVVNDPLSLTKQREIRKTLRAVEEVK
jgi:Tfp pilus assembly protein PilP